MVSVRTTELSESNAKSRIAEANLRAVFNSALVSIVEADMDGIITNFNRGAELQLGYKAEGVVNKLSPTFFHLEKEITERGDELTKLFGREIKGNDVFIEYAKHGTHESKKWTYLRKDGSTFPVQLVVSPITDDQGITTGFLGVATDISDLEDAKSDLEVLAGRLQKQNNQLLNFARITSHNLRSPVSNLNTILYLYKESEGDEKETLFDHFETVIHHLTETLDELVESLKIQEEPDRESEWVNFEDVFNKTKQILAGAIIETQAVVTADFSKADKIDYPKSYLESIMLNLLSNAMKYRSPKRIPVIHFQTADINGEITMKVSDNGLGIDLKKHGNSLFGLNKTFHDHAEAKGVGLYITKKQIEAMGGYISAESKVEKGTTFTVFFDKNKKNS
jgi:PAS domain S-box-containing protein